MNTFLLFLFGPPSHYTVLIDECIDQVHICTDCPADRPITRFSFFRVYAQDYRFDRLTRLANYDHTRLERVCMSDK